MRSIVKWVSPGLLGAIGAMGVCEPSPAAMLNSFGHAAGLQCAALDVNDSGGTVGVCSRPPSIAGESTNGLAVAWFATTGTNGNPGAQTRLPPLVSGRSCTAVGITNSGRVIGSCDRANSVSTAVYWNSAVPLTAPVELSPLPGLLGLGADLSTMATGYNQAGAVIGQSFSDTTSTAVLWTAGSGAPVQVSARGDNCLAADIMEQVGSGRPTILLNCPYVGLEASLRQTIVPKMATPTGLLGAYVVAPLAKNETATYCVAQSINSGLRIAGTCYLPLTPFEVAATWNSPSAAATVINLRDANLIVRKSSSVALNDLGHLAIRYETDDGRSNAGFIDLSANPVTFKQVPPLHAGTGVSVIGLGENDLVLVSGINDDEQGQAAVWNPTSLGVVTPVPLYGGGPRNALSSMSSGGFYAVGAAVDSNHVVNAVQATLP